MLARFAVTTVLLSVATTFLRAEVKTEHFDADPKWDALHNHITPEKAATVVQDFGYRPDKGDIGGRVQRAAKPAYYAAKIEPKTLNNKLSASGAFTLEKSTSACEVFFGW